MHESGVSIAMTSSILYVYAFICNNVLHQVCFICVTAYHANTRIQMFTLDAQYASKAKPHCKQPGWNGKVT